jgi:hypothetical protein
MNKNFSFNIWKSETAARLAATGIDLDELELDYLLTAFDAGRTPEQIILEQATISD